MHMGRPGVVPDFGFVPWGAKAGPAYIQFFSWLMKN